MAAKRLIMLSYEPGACQNAGRLIGSHSKMLVTWMRNASQTGVSQPITNLRFNDGSRPCCAQLTWVQLFRGSWNRRVIAL